MKPLPTKEHAPNYGLAASILSSTETFAQSVAGIGPSATPAIMVAIVFGMAGGGAWLTYVVATSIMILTAMCLSVFASREASPGSLYSYATTAGGRRAGFIAGWAMLLVYVSGVACGSVQSAVFADAFLQYCGIHWISPLLLMALSLLAMTLIAYKNVKLSAEFMLWMEIASVGIILALVWQVVAHHGFQLDARQLHLTGCTPQGFYMGLAMAMLAFGGFESATTLGSEARLPLEKIPQALMGSVILSGTFFVISTYAIVQGFGDTHVNLGTCSAPLVVLCDRLGIGWLGGLTSLGAAACFFAASLAAKTAAARVMLAMSHDGFLHGYLRAVHPRNQTPSAAICTSAVLALVIICILLSFHATSLDIVGWLGTLCTYGFIIAYSVVSACVPAFLRSRRELKARHIAISILATTSMLAALVANVAPLPPAPYCYLLFICLGFFLTGGVHYWWVGKDAASRAETVTSGTRHEEFELLSQD